MWHEARRRERATQKLLNDHKKRNDRRREENRVDPNSLLRIYGVKSKLSLDPNVYKQATNSLVPWQGDQSITIDRYDVRATLTSLSFIETKSDPQDKKKPVIDSDESHFMKKLLTYERYRLLIQNEINMIPEEVKLKVVAKAEGGSEAKMRKLQNNKFGTSGEVVIPSKPNLYTGHAAKNLESYSRIPPSLKISTSDYSSVPPPSSQTDPDNHNSIMVSTHDNEPSTESGSLSSKVIDLDDYETLEFDNIDQISKNFSDEAKLSCVIRRYNMSGDEFLFLAGIDGQELSTNEMLKGLKLMHKKRDENEDKQDSKLYGPSLPPEFQDDNNQSDAKPQPGDDDSPIQQRSPRGSDIPLRENRSPKEQSREKTPSVKSDNQEEPLKKDDMSPQKRTSRDDEPRRASTPLAYKRYSRSDRSISRERRTHHRRHKKSSRRRSRSRD